jgi:hypothetical protein
MILLSNNAGNYARELIPVTFSRHQQIKKCFIFTIIARDSPPHVKTQAIEQKRNIFP